ncbi:precorrin-6Y C5,15-methyltransferase (decarboxylating) subunit CbiT [Clostridium kluyveri]|uniref:precorrin-6Y C5,15-methyltransferase (decarboxylating) subunit CbiT n=1 Tax=Clostridium kluyveri TaxID=1534 RepID=UPI002247AE65|nr:precorrin-6Y C5,15-methyltransferase (decarboxylating) subunit CbiT [Clostridium kluyveri]UZQ51880.1 precorrin-6Y C5,15-methyltransferase (decarboxylating) subunit CbiT [Clostridium kluyveri]
MIYIKDEEFVRGNCPMTKEEIRILSIAKMEIKDKDILLDIGAGTGSLSIQMSKCSPLGKVIAVERDKEALEILEKNKKKFEADNLYIVKGEALQVEPDIEKLFDAIFIGGSGGNIGEIIRRYSLKLKKGGKMVMNFITIDNLYKAMEALKALEFETECTQVGISKTKNKGYMLFSNNSIYILSGKK